MHYFGGEISFCKQKDYLHENFAFYKQNNAQEPAIMMLYVYLKSNFEFLQRLCFVCRDIITRNTVGENSSIVNKEIQTK